VISSEREKRGQTKLWCQGPGSLKGLLGRQVDTRRAIACIVVPSQLKPSGTGRRSITLRKGCPLFSLCSCSGGGHWGRRGVVKGFQDSVCSEILAYLLAQVNSIWRRTQAEVRAPSWKQAKWQFRLFTTAHGDVVVAPIPFASVIRVRRHAHVWANRCLTYLPDD